MVVCGVVPDGLALPARCPAVLRRLSKWPAARYRRDDTGDPEPVAFIDSELCKQSLRIRPMLQGRAGRTSRGPIVVMTRPGEDGCRLAQMGRAHVGDPGMGIVSPALDHEPGGVGHERGRALISRQTARSSSKCAWHLSGSFPGPA
jgi:hypothetical protein